MSMRTVSLCCKPARRKFDCGNRCIYREEIADVRQEVAGSYVLTKPSQAEKVSQVGFQLAAYRFSAGLLIIDPILSYATYLGGTGFDVGKSIAVDTTGSVYVTGETESNNFPTTPGAFQTGLADNTNNLFTRGRRLCHETDS